MRSIILRIASLVMLSIPSLASAQSNPVVVELFSSQGCSSCPPADDFLAELVGRDDILPLALHVDYWDRLGWKDTFATAEFTARQYEYGRSFQNRSVWTPQFVVQGKSYSRGKFRNEVAGFLKEARAEQGRVSLQASVQGATLTINASPAANNLPTMLISIVSYRPAEVVKIKRGENTGRTITYHNTVSSWDVVGKWNGRSNAALSVPLSVTRPFAVIVQAEKTGPIFAAANFN